MPAGLPYFAWIDVSETTFGPEHMRWDEQVFSFTLAQEEGDPANLTVAVRRPRNLAGDPIGLLGPGRKIWAWFALDCGPALVKFRGRLVGIPTSIFEELVTLEFVARPFNVVAQKEALAATLRVLPYYDEAVIAPARRTDPDVVLEGYTKIWHYDRESHVITVSDEITGEDGLVEFECATGDVLYDGLGLNLTTGPLSRVDVSAEYTWTLQAHGTVDLTNYLISNWPETSNGAIVSYTMKAADWPKNGAGIGDGWEVASSTAYDVYDYTVSSATTGSSMVVVFPDGSGGRTQSTITRPVFSVPYINLGGHGSSSTNVTYAIDGDKRLYASSTSASNSITNTVLPVQAFVPTLVAGYTAERPYTERVTFSLFADVQSILTDPEDGEALLLDDIKSINLSDPELGTLIGDTRRRSYIATERGNQSLEYLIAFARAHLMKRARAVEITFAPKLARMPEVTLRKNAFLNEPRIGQATGKIIGYSIALDGSDGRPNCEVRIGCTIGRGGSAIAMGGEPTYCTVDYTGFDYQQFTGRTILFDSSVGYEPPNAAPNDDGIDFLSTLRVEDVIESGLVVEFGKEEQEDTIQGDNKWPPPAVSVDMTPPSPDENAVRAKYYKDIMHQLEMTGTFKLKSMKREFASDYPLQVTDLKIPTGYDLEAV